MGRIGRLISSKIETFIVNVVETRFKYNVTSNSYGPSGDDSPGLPDERMAVMKIDGAGKWVVVGVLVKSQGAEAGEKILYSRDSAGAVKATVKLLKDGVIELNGNADFAVAFNDLKAGFDALKDDLNTFITTKYNLHTHVSVTSLGTPTVPIPTGSSSSASIDASKIDSVKVP